MKKFIPSSFLLAALTTGVAFSQTTAYTTPVGYSTTTLVNGFNVLGLTLQASAVSSGSLSSVGASSVTVSTADFTTALTAGATYILEITSGAKNGAIQEITSWTATTLNTPDNLLTAGVEATASYKLRKAPTLEDVFGTTASVLKKGATATLADVVWVPTGPGTYNRYFLNTSSAWRNAAGGAALNKPIIYTDGILVEHKTTNVDLVTSGEVKTSVTGSVISKGFNLIGTVYPAGVTLQNVGLSNLKKGATATLADVVWVPKGPGVYDRYFLNTSNVWRNAAGGAATADLPLTSGILIEKKDAGNTTLTLTAPTAYSSL